MKTKDDDRDEEEVARKLEEVEDELNELGYDEYRQRVTEIRSEFVSQLIEDEFE